MPTYEYKCENCGHQFDVYQSMKDEKLKECPNCGKNTLRRLIGSGGGLIFKGSGFYLTDYKNKPAESSAVKNSAAETKKTDSSPAKTDNEKITTPVPKDSKNSKDSKSPSSETKNKKSESDKRD